MKNKISLISGNTTVQVQKKMYYWGRRLYRSMSRIIIKKNLSKSICLSCEFWNLVYIFSAALKPSFSLERIGLKREENPCTQSLYTKFESFLKQVASAVDWCIQQKIFVFFRCDLTKNLDKSLQVISNLFCSCSIFIGVHINKTGFL